MRTFRPALLTLTFTSFCTVAAEPELSPPNLPEDMILDEIEAVPEVTIFHTDHDVLEEYRLGGQVYMIKITPKHGKPYYLVDKNGDGTLEISRHALDAQISIPRWKILEWD